MAQQFDFYCYAFSVTIGLDGEEIFDTIGFGKLCVKSGFENIPDLEACKSASEYYGKSFDGSEKAHNYPRGCYIEENNETVYFNYHEIGEENSLANPICNVRGW